MLWQVYAATYFLKYLLDIVEMCARVYKDYYGKCYIHSACLLLSEVSSIQFVQYNNIVVKCPCTLYIGVVVNKGT